MQVEVRTRFKGLTSNAPELILDVLLLPRGSGNRRVARQMAEQLREDRHLKPHIGKIVAGASRVSVHMPITVGMQKAIDAFLAERKEQQQDHDVPGQLPLAFG